MEFEHVERQSRPRTARGVALALRPRRAVLWATVFSLAHEQWFDLRGEISPAFGGPRTWQLHCELEDKGPGTLVHLVDSTIGKIDAEGAQAVRDGWEMLFGEGGLKGYVES